jgi:3-oxoacyl-[acyl-carrier-protein] synthase-3
MSFLRPSRDVFVIGPAAHLPERRMHNRDVLDWMGVAARPSWISHRTGVEERRWVAPGVACSDLAVAAASALLDTHAIARARVGQLLLATISGDHPTPPTAPLVHGRLGLEAAGALDLGAACAGFTSGLHVGAALHLATGSELLLVAADIRSKFLHRRDLATTALFGDGAASCLITGERQGARFRLQASELGANPSIAELIGIRAGGSRLPHHQSQDEHDGYLRMAHGATLFVKGAELMSEAGRSLLARAACHVDDIDWLVPHQANLHLMHAMADKLGVPRHKVVETVQFTGNTSGASVGIALSHLAANLPLASGQRVLLVSAGAGGSSACALLESL